MSSNSSDETDFKILSLDGGGIKGLFSAAVLAALEEDMEISIADHFDLITGTSTGGIIAIGLALGMRPREIVSFYVQEGPQIFKPSRWKAIKHLWSAKHSSDPLRNALKKVLGDKRLGDCKKRLVVPSFNLDRNEVYMFKTPHHSRLKRDWRVPLWKVAMATTAAPSYFECCREVDRIRMVDGGLWANNPTMVGIVEAMSLLDVPKARISTLSLGCTNSIENKSNKLNRGGLWQWRKAGIDAAMCGQSHGIQGQAQLLLGIENALRLNPAVSPGLFALDQLNEDRLLSEAAHASRNFAPQFEQAFFSHKAAPYQPFYSLSHESDVSVASATQN